MLGEWDRQERRRTSKGEGRRKGDGKERRDREGRRPERGESRPHGHF